MNAHCNVEIQVAGGEQKECSDKSHLSSSQPSNAVGRGRVVYGQVGQARQREAIAAPHSFPFSPFRSIAPPLPPDSFLLRGREMRYREQVEREKASGCVRARERERAGGWARRDKYHRSAHISLPGVELREGRNCSGTKESGVKASKHQFGLSNKKIRRVE
jgi:hypothetical protein